MTELLWSVDSLLIKENVLFSFGWIFHESQEIALLRLRVDFKGKKKLPPGYLVANAGKPRRDVELAFPDKKRALHSGYVVFGAFPNAAPPDSITLECSLADGSVLERTVSASSVVGRADEKAAQQPRLRQLGVSFTQGVRLLGAGRFKELLVKAMRRFSQRPVAAPDHSPDIGDLLGEDERSDVCVIVDHDLGGGANQYRDRLINSVISEGRSAVLLTYDVSTLSHLIVIRNRRLNVRYSISGTADLFGIVKGLAVNEIVYNTAVSFVQPEEIPELLIHLKKLTGAQLKVLVHDFYLVCPSHFLLDFQGKFCDIPDTGICSNCLPKNQQEFATLFVPRDMRMWRKIWGAFLVAADQIVAFSNSTAQLLLKAYPQVDRSRVSITPHRVEHLTSGVVRLRDKGRLCIGVVGHIAFHKGANFVQALAREIKDRGAELSIVVIGSIEAHCEPSVVRQTGAYKHSELPGIIEASGANVMLFPSICPETFSYVVQELMELRLPVAAFNFGAPAERLGSYEKGLVLTSMEPASVLDELIAFHREIYLE
ncbi:glycosyltransferase [Accumulibacter sp.]|uniref:glycosyltransferase n=1 Tax=Accumulibacter sp. TaxID=2053492 RepID=UPI002B514C36|nr:glycosyltransferase [Accumulibacter sp.]HRF05559.1 glycosyltransferase [Accumulibacter sp.]